MFFFLLDMEENELEQICACDLCDYKANHGNALNKHKMVKRFFSSSEFKNIQFLTDLQHLDIHDF